MDSIANSVGDNTGASTKLLYYNMHDENDYFWLTWLRVLSDSVSEFLSPVFKIEDDAWRNNIIFKLNII